jgi:hypothetical protein
MWNSSGQHQRQPHTRRPLRHRHVHLSQWQICRPLCHRQTLRLLASSIKLSSSIRKTLAPPLDNGIALAVPDESANAPAPATPPRQIRKLRRLKLFIDLLLWNAENFSDLNLQNISGAPAKFKARKIAGRRCMRALRRHPPVGAPSPSQHEPPRPQRHNTPEGRQNFRKMRQYAACEK